MYKGDAQRYLWYPSNTSLNLEMIYPYLSHLISSFLPTIAIAQPWIVNNVVILDKGSPNPMFFNSFKATNYNACWCDHLEKWVYHHKVIYPNTKYQTKHTMSLWSISNIFQEFSNMHVIMVQNRCITTFSNTYGWTKKSICKGFIKRIC
jgi:hypothetical protein